MSPKHLDRPGSGLVPRWVRLSFRILVGVSFACFPLYDNTSSVFELSLYTSTLCLLCLAETLGKIGTVGNDTSVPQKHDRYGYPDISRPILPEDAEAIAANRQHVQGVLHDGELKGLDDVTYRVGHKLFGREDLTAHEKGEEDVGGNSQVGVMRAITVRRGQRKSALSLRLFGSSELMPDSRNWICSVLRDEYIKTGSHTYESVASWTSHHGPLGQFCHTLSINIVGVARTRVGTRLLSVGACCRVVIGRHKVSFLRPLRIVVERVDSYTV